MFRLFERLLKPTDLLPTLRAGVTATPDALWTYYDQREKKVYTRDNAAALSPVPTTLTLVTATPDVL